MRLAFHAKGDSRRAQASAAETMWADVESRSLAQLVDAAVKLRESLSLPLEMCWQMVGMSPQQIKQAKNIIGLPDKAQAASGNGGGNPQAVVLPAGVQG